MTSRYPLVLNGTSIQELQAGDTLAGIPTALSSFTDDVGFETSSHASSTYLALAGGALTGGLREAKVALSNSNIDCTAGNFFTKTISGTTTFTVSNVPTTGTVASFVLVLTNAGSATINWWSGVKWAGGTAPTGLTSSGVDALGFFTFDGGTTWTGLVLGKDIK